MVNKIKKDVTNTLNNLAIEFYHITLVKLADDFKQCLQNMYEVNNQWKWILDMIKWMNQSCWNSPSNCEISLLLKFFQGAVTENSD